MEKDNDFQFGIFLEKNYHLFVIIGIFGALSIYLNTMDLKTIPTVSAMLQIGIAASLFLFVLVSVLIFFNAFKNHDGGPIPLSYFIPPTMGKLMRILFIAPLFLLVLVIIYFVYNTFPEASNVVFAAISLFIGIMVFLVILWLMDYFMLKDRIVFVALLFLAVVSVLGNYYATKYDFIPCALFCSLLVQGSIIGLIVIPISRFCIKYKKKREGSQIARKILRESDKNGR